MSWGTKYLNKVLGWGGLEAIPIDASYNEYKNYVLNGGGGLTEAGVRMNAETAMQVSAVSACVRILSGTIASLPFKVFRRGADGSKHVVNDHPVERVFTKKSNPWQTGFMVREQGQASTTLRGNAHWLRIQMRDSLELWPIAESRVTVKQLESGVLKYVVAQDSSSPVATHSEKTYSQKQIFHIRGLSTDGISGRSVIGDHRETFGLSRSQERFGARLYGKGAHFTGVLEHPGVLKGKQRENIEKSWVETKGGIDNSQGVLVLEEAMKFAKISMSAEDAQYLEARKFQVTDIARIFLIPPSMIASVQGMPRSNVSEESRKFVMHALRQWLERWEDQINNDLFDPITEKDLFAEFNVAGLLRGELKARYDAYAIGRTHGWLSVNEIRKLENMNPIENGDVYLEQLNMVPVGSDRQDRETEESDEETDGQEDES